MKRIYQYITVLFFALGTNTISGQVADTFNRQLVKEPVSYDLLPVPEEKSKILDDLYILAKSGVNGIDIRWAPTNLRTWNMGLSHGYRLERLSLNKDTTLSEAGFELVTGSAIKPWPLDDWQSIVSDEKPYCAIAAMTIYGDEKNVQSGFVNQADAQENRLGFNLLAADLDRDAAIASGLRYQAIGTGLAESGGIYRVFAYDEINQTSSDTAYITTVYTGYEKLSPPTMVDSIEYENALAIRWHNKKGRKAFSGFHIERSSDGKEFKRITKRPFINAVTDLRKDNNFITYIDSVAENNVTYHYRVIGIDAFGDESMPSDIQKAIARDKISISAAVNLNVVQEGTEALKLTWELPEHNNGKKIAGFKIYKSIDYDEGFECVTDELLEPTTTSYVDYKPDAVETNYYYVSVVDNYGKEVKSGLTFGFTKDEIAPQPVTNLTAETDTTGAVMIEWTPPNDLDIRGYRVFWSYTENGEFVVKPGKLLTNPYFVDQVQLRSLTEDIYYYVLAVDYSYNRSQASEIIKLKKPDIIPPAASIFSDYKVSEEGIYFEWIASTSNDVMEISLERKSNKDASWIKVESFDRSKNNFLDVDVEGGQLYEYRLVTSDDDGNITYTQKPLTLEALTPFFIASVSDFSVSKDDNKVQLSWSYNNAEEYDYIIYRAINDGNPRTLKKLRGLTTYVDQVNDKKNIKYYIKAKAKDGRESKMSEEVKL